MPWPEEGERERWGITRECTSSQLGLLLVAIGHIHEARRQGGRRLRFSHCLRRRLCLLQGRLPPGLWSKIS